MMSRVLVWVALYARAWVEIIALCRRHRFLAVALYARAWVEIKRFANLSPHLYVALYARAWVEMILSMTISAN